MYSHIHCCLQVHCTTAAWLSSQLMFLLRCIHSRDVLKSFLSQSCLPACCSLQLKELSRQLKLYVTCSPVLQLRGSSTWVGSAGFDLQMHVPAKFASQVPPVGKYWGPSRTKVTIYR